MEKTLLQKLDAEMPPFWCAAWAREKARGKQAGPKVISQRTGVPYRTVQRIFASITWKGINIEVVSALLEAARVRMQSKTTIIRMNEIRAYLRWCASHRAKEGHPALRPFAYMSDNQFKLFSRRSKKWLENQGSVK